MRVITGTARGLRLETLAGDEVVRPTAEMVKEAIFSIIQFRLGGAKVLDLFAGSGQLGIEALSRGASKCTFVDQSREAAVVVMRNLRHTNLNGDARVVTGDAVRFVRDCKDQYDIVLLDPPYNKGLAAEVLDKLSDVVAENGCVLCETEKGCPLPEQAGALNLFKTYRYGKTLIWQYKKQTQA